MLIMLWAEGRVACHTTVVEVRIMEVVVMEVMEVEVQSW